MMLNIAKDNLYLHYSSKRISFKVGSDLHTKHASPDYTPSCMRINAPNRKCCGKIKLRFDENHKDCGSCGCKRSPISTRFHRSGCRIILDVKNRFICPFRHHLRTLYVLRAVLQPSHLPCPIIIRPDPTCAQITLYAVLINYYLMMFNAACPLSW